MVNRGYGDDAGGDTELLKLPGWFCDEATAHFIAGGRKERRQR
jgi:hypothetical protein